MGGYHLQAPGYPTFPLGGNQLYFLISNGYVEFPPEDETDIDDRNKRDGLARSVEVSLLLGASSTDISQTFDSHTNPGFPNQKHREGISAPSYYVA